jgi:hypothetical protein
MLLRDHASWRVKRKWGGSVVGDVRRLYAVATVVLRWRRELAVDASWRAFEQGFKV